MITNTMMRLGLDITTFVSSYSCGISLFKLFCLDFVFDLLLLGLLVSGLKNT